MGESNSTIAIPVDKLLLDPENPRLPEDLLNSSQTAILEWLHNHEVLDELARSLITNGYFLHEPLIVLPADAEGNYLVVEGNRRLAALIILLQLPVAIEGGLQFSFEVQPTTEQLERLQLIPCYVATDKLEVHKFLGFRHIGGLKTWSPESKARYLEAEIERAIDAGVDDPIRDVARQVGSTVPAVRGQYLALKVLRAAEQDFGIDNQVIMSERFGVWNRLMNSRDVRSFIQLKDVRSAKDIMQAVNDLNGASLAQVIGDLTPPFSGGKAVLWDSRDVTVYGNVLVNEKALASLKRYGDLSIARQMVERAQLPERIRSIARSIEVITQDIDSYDIDHHLDDLASGLFSSARTLRDAIRGRLDDDD